MNAEIIFIRHGETVWNREQRLQGHGDSPLTSEGRNQVAAHLQWLRERRPQRMLASPLGRAQASAAILAGPLRLRIETCEALKERCMGVYEGWTLTRLEQDAPDDARARRQDPWAFRAPGGENMPDMLARVEPVLDALRQEATGTVVIVSHGSLVRPMLGHLLGLPPEQMLRILQPNELAYRVVLGQSERVYRHSGRELAEGLLLTEPG